MRHPPDEVYAAVRDTDPDALDGDELDRYLGQIAELRAWCDARQVRATRRQRSLAAEGRAAAPRHGLSEHGRQSSREAAAASEREQVCTVMPGFEDALSDGSVSSGHVDAIARATKGLEDEELSEFVASADDLLADARRNGVDAFAKGCRDLAGNIRSRNNSRSDVDELEQQRSQSKISRWVDRQTGMHKTLIEADPVTDRHLWAAIQRSRGILRRRNQHAGSAGKVSWDRLTVDALVHAVSSDPASTSGGTGSGGVVVHIDLDSIKGGRHDTTLCETDSGVPVPVDVARRMACEGHIIPMVLDGDGVVLDEGRAKRLATQEQRIAIEAMQSTCSHPNCTVPIDDCRIHHLDPWSLGGSTDLGRLAPLCEPHHHLVHEGGWTLTMTPDRTGTWVRPDGATYWTGTLIDRRPANTPAA